MAADLVSMLRELTALAVGFVSVTEALDLTTPAGRAMAGLLSVFAEFERDIMRERVLAGLAHARSQRQTTRSAAAGRWQSELSPGPISRRNQQSGDCAAVANRPNVGPAAAGTGEILSGVGLRRRAERTQKIGLINSPARTESGGGC